MTFSDILESLLIGPLKILFEMIFQYALILVGSPWLAIVVLSFTMNILVLPLYKRADAMQEEARDIDAKLSKGVSHIKKVFSGDEKMMILQTYYRQNNYKPTDALKGSVSLLLEIPFFMAAYQFLSNLDVLRGATFGPISDLGKPDGLIVIGGIVFNVLPILMTLVNVISSAIYLKGFPLKTKIQLYGMALFFLFFLYQSPSGLVFYWTLNNVFSLVKTIFYKLKNPKKVLLILAFIFGVVLCGFGIIAFILNISTVNRIIFVFGLGILLLSPLTIKFLSKKLKIKLTLKLKSTMLPNKKTFVFGSLFLTILVGALIPSSVISSSPQEFVDINNYYNPLWYIVSSLTLSIGTFLIWMRVFYWLANEKVKVLFDKLVWVLCGVMLMNYMFFGTDLGILDFSLQYESGMSFSTFEIILNIILVLIIIPILYALSTKYRNLVTSVLLVGSVAIGSMAAINVVKTHNSIKKVSTVYLEKMPKLDLSTEGKNVVVLMLDRAMGEYIPYILNEKPELKEQFDGFTYYSNTISFGGHTNFGSPALLGGYEYTPVEMNKRSDEKLVSKHNEALKVLPTLFSNNGYDVTVCDPPYGNYNWATDLSVYDDNPDIKSYIAKGKFGNNTDFQQLKRDNNRNFFCFSIMKTLPLFVQPIVYMDGTYNNTGSLYMSYQVIEGTSVAYGYKKNFMESYEVLSNLSNITNISEDGKNTFLFMANDATHEVALLQEPEYVPGQRVDNTEYDKNNKDRFTLNGESIDVSTGNQLAHYQSNVASLIQLAEWFDYLRLNNVYDNTKIIIVADHGYCLHQNKDLLFYNITEQIEDVSQYSPLLLVKDFNSTGFKISDEFMTNADVPTLATINAIDNPVNPFTGKPITSDEKTAHDQMICLSHEYDVDKNNGNTYMSSKWATVKGYIRDRNNWEFSDEEIVLKDHKLP